MALTETNSEGLKEQSLWFWIELIQVETWLTDHGNEPLLCWQLSNVATSGLSKMESRFTMVRWSSPVTPLSSLKSLILLTNQHTLLTASWRQSNSKDELTWKIKLTDIGTCAFDNLKPAPFNVGSYSLVDASQSLPYYTSTMNPAVRRRNSSRSWLAVDGESSINSK